MVKFIDKERFNQIDSVNITQIAVAFTKNFNFCLIENADKSIFMLVCSIKILHITLFKVDIFRLHNLSHPSIIQFTLCMLTISIYKYEKKKKNSSHFIGTSNSIPPIK